jgi:hypothetical protein
MNEIYTLVLVLGASALSIGLLVALNAFMGGWTASQLTDIETAAKRIRVDVLNFEPSARGVLDADQAAALVFETGDKRLGLAVCLGDRISVRALRPAELVSASSSGAQLVLTLDDYTLPTVNLRLSDSAMAARWADEINAFIGQDSSEMAHA